MRPANILRDTTPRADDTRPNLVHSVITDAWGLYFAQGGVVMAAALRAMSLVLDRQDLILAGASAVFCRPVACGPVRTKVEVLRDGRRGAQVLGSLSDQTASHDSTSVAVTAVFTDPQLPGPTLTPLSIPTELLTAPGRDSGSAIENNFPLGFLDNTAWHVAAGPDSHTQTQSRGGSDPYKAYEGTLPRLALWFGFNDPPAPVGIDWDPALLAIPGDSLGSALMVALGEGGNPVGSVSLQIDLQVLAPISGRWIGIDSTCTHVGSGLARGIVNLWSESGTHVATISQNAMLRGLGE